ncbi:MAG: ATP synthase F1 subunit delta [Bacteroidetes bacterium]|nr:MAG: ATP synthase F1 subunit delta [Bacteroidota bacterium]
MSVQRIASRYAKSLLELSQEQNKLERIVEDIKSFQQATQNRDLYLLLKSPIVKADKKMSVLEAIFGDKYDELTLAFFRILVQKGREPLLSEIAAEFLAQYKDLKHITTVKLTTARPLREASLQALKKKLEADERIETVELETATDADLIGGFVLEMGDRIYDASVQHKLESLKRQFTGNTYVSQIVKK